MQKVIKQFDIISTQLYNRIYKGGTVMGLTVGDLIASRNYVGKLVYLNGKEINIYHPKYRQLQIKKIVRNFIIRAEYLITEEVTK